MGDLLLRNDSIASNIHTLSMKDEAWSTFASLRVPSNLPGTLIPLQRHIGADLGVEIVNIMNLYKYHSDSISVGHCLLLQCDAVGHPFTASFCIGSNIM